MLVGVGIIGTDAFHITFRMGFQIEEKTVIGVGQQEAILIDITQQGDGHAVSIITEVALHILIRIGRLHGINGCHQTGVLIHRIAVHHDILHDGAQLLVATRLQPGCDPTVIQITDGQFLILEKQGNQLMDIVSHQILVWVDDKALVLQEGRRHIDLRTTAKEPLLYLLITPAVIRIDNGQTLYNHPHTLGQFLHMGDTAFILLTHHDTLVRTHGRLTQPQGHQTDTERIIVGCRGHLHHTVNHVGVHLGSGIDGGTGLGGLMGLAILIENAGDAEIAKHQFCMLLVAEEEIRRFDILMQNITLVTVSQGSRTLQGDTTELVDVAVQMIFAHRTTTKVFHELIIAVLALYVGLTVIVDPHDHLEIEVVDCLEDLPVDIEIGIVDLQNEVLTITFNEKHLGLTRVVTQRLNVPVCDTFQEKRILLHVFTLGNDTYPIRAFHLGNRHGRSRRSYRSVYYSIIRCRTTSLVYIPCLIGIEWPYRAHYKSSLISFLVFLPRITHLPPIWGLAQPQGLEWSACLKLHSHANLTP